MLDSGEDAGQVHSRDSSRDGGSLTTEVFDAVSAAAGVDPMDLPPLYEVVDPDALDALFACDSAEGTGRAGAVAFDYYGYRVTARSDGSVDVRALEDVP